MSATIFRLQPGEAACYRVRPIGQPGREELRLDVQRPDEGPSPELVLSVSDADGRKLDSGRIPLERGYLAVVIEVRRQIERDGCWNGLREFELLQVPAAGAVDRAEPEPRADAAS